MSFGIPWSLRCRNYSKKNSRIFASIVIARVKFFGVISIDPNNTLMPASDILRRRGRRIKDAFLNVGHFSVGYSIYLSLIVYALRVPFIAAPKITFSMVYHVRAEGNEFIKTKNTDGDNREHMFAFVAGLTSQQIGFLLTDLIRRWQDVVDDHCMENRSCVCLTHESLLPPFYSQGILKQLTLSSST
jgi:hypothetical protein